MKKAILALILIVAVGLSGVALGYMLWQSRKPVNQTELEQQVVEFLNTTDIKNVWDGTVEIIETYDHRNGGKIVVVEYTTTGRGHPQFVLTAFEDHRAVIALNDNGEITFAFCLHGSFQDGKAWDLINQQWIPENV